VSSCWLKLGCAALIALTACGPTAVPTNVPTRLSEDTLLVPDDLDIVVRLDLVRFRSHWPSATNQRILRVLNDYGLVSISGETSDRLLLQQILQAAQQLWIACRPTLDGCSDAVLSARGNFQNAPTQAATHGFSKPVLSTNGWSRLDRLGRVTRESVARVYSLLPDRLMTVAPAELDSTERGVEFGQGGSTLVPEARGVLSVALRTRSMARQLERRSPAAARLLRDAKDVRMWLDVEHERAALTVSVGFDDAPTAARTQQAWVVFATALSGLSDRDSITADVVGNALTMRVPVRLDSPIADPASSLSGAWKASDSAVK
jgi:hypothetical protein